LSPNAFSPIPTSLRRESAIREKRFLGPGSGETVSAIGPSQRRLLARPCLLLKALYGYGVEITGIYDRQTRQVVAAFQRHFRPERVDGEADASTIATLKALIDGLTRVA
jgi:hypothetical protein